MKELSTILSVDPKGKLAYNQKEAAWELAENMRKLHDGLKRISMRAEDYRRMLGLLTDSDGATEIAFQERMKKLRGHKNGSL